MLKNLLKLIKNLNFFLKFKFIWINPKPKEILVFDDESYLEIKDMIKKYNHNILVVRKENIKHLYISLKILILTIYD